MCCDSPDLTRGLVNIVQHDLRITTPSREVISENKRQRIEKVSRRILWWRLSRKAQLHSEEIS